MRPVPARARALRKAAASGHPLGRTGISSLWRSVPKKLLGQVSANIQLHIGDAFFMDTSLGNSAHDRSSHMRRTIVAGAKKAGPVRKASWLDALRQKSERAGQHRPKPSKAEEAQDAGTSLCLFRVTCCQF